MNRFLVLLTVAGLALGSLLLSALLPGCADLKEGDTVTSPAEDTPNDDFGQLEADAGRRQTWIDRMDPYVTQAPDSTYSLDWQGFLRSVSVSHPELIRYFAAGGQPSEDAKVIQELKDGIPLANGEVLQQSLKKETSPQGQVCWTFWWGRKCCYWGAEGWQLVYIVGAGLAYPPFGYLLSPFAGLCGYYMSVYGGFCVNWAWTGCLWIQHS